MVLLTTRPLGPATWAPYADLIERHNGVWGGCWCMGYHPKGAGWGKSAALNRAEKEARVQDGTAHAGLVFNGEVCVGWCQFGSPAELPRVKHRKAYEAGNPDMPDWRITCFFVDTAARKHGVAAKALDCALSEIARLGGGRVEAHTEDTAGRKVSGSFLYSGTLAMYLVQGFEPLRKLGKNIWLVSKTVPASGH